jgi:methionyl-tRNA formyltransferase
VYFKKLFPMGVDAMIEALELVRAGCVLRHAQNLADGSYEGWFKKEVVEIDWGKPVADVYNLIRAANPAPGAWGTIKGAKVDIFDSAKVAGDGAPGRVLAVSEQGMTIAAQGGAILAKRVRGADGKKVAAAEWAKAAGVVAGDTFEKPAPKS